MRDVSEDRRRRGGWMQMEIYSPICSPLVVLFSLIPKSAHDDKHGSATTGVEKLSNKQACARHIGLFFGHYLH